MPNQVRISVGSHTDFSLFVTNPALIRVLRTNFDKVSGFEYSDSIDKPSSKKQAILITCRRQYFINGHNTLVNTIGAVVGPNGGTVKTK